MSRSAHVAYLRPYAAVLAAAVVTTFASHARADDEEDARAAMRRGVAAFGRGDAEGALVEYEAAAKLAPMANAPHRYAAEALMSLGRWQEAVTSLEAYVAKNPSVHDAADVQKKIARIRAEHFPARLKVTSPGASGATVSIDGERRGASSTFTLAPGRHSVVVEAPARIAATAEVTLEGDQERELVVALGMPPVVSTPPPAIGNGGADATAPADATTASPWRKVGWLTLSTGVATIATAFVLDVAVLGPKVDDWRTAADAGDPSARALREEASGLQTGVAVTYGVGAALACAGGAMIVFGPRSSKASSSLVVAPSLTPRLAGISGHVAF